MALKRKTSSDSDGDDDDLSPSGGDEKRRRCEPLFTVIDLPDDVLKIVMFGLRDDFTGKKTMKELEWNVLYRTHRRFRDILKTNPPVALRVKPIDYGEGLEKVQGRGRPKPTHRIEITTPKTENDRLVCVFQKRRVFFDCGIKTCGWTFHRGSVSMSTVGMLKWFYDETVTHDEDDGRSLVRTAKEVFVLAAVKLCVSIGDVLGLDWLQNSVDSHVGDVTADIVTGNYAIYKEAAMRGHVKVLEWVRTRFAAQKNGKRPTYDDVILIAAGEGHLEATKRLIADGHHYTRNVLVEMAAEKGHIHILRWILSLAEDPACKLRWDKSVASRDEATDLSNKYIWKLGLFLKVWGWTKTTILFAIVQNRIDTLQYLLSHGKHEALTENVAIAAARTGDFKTFALLVGKGCPYVKRDCAETAKANGHYGMVNWINKNY